MKRQKRAKPQELSRDISIVRRLIKEWGGGMLLFDVLDLLQDDLKSRKSGAPKEWDDGALLSIYRDVEELMIAKNVKQQRACLTVAWWNRISFKVIEARRIQGQAAWESLPEEKRILHADISRDRVRRNLMKFGMLPTGAKLPSSTGRRGFGLMRPDERRRVIQIDKRLRAQRAVLLSTDACIATEDRDYLVLAVRLDKDRLRANPGAFVIGEHFTPSPGLLAAIDRHLTPIPAREIES
jgi:hypothetical protein